MSASHTEDSVFESGLKSLLSCLRFSLVFLVSEPCKWRTINVVTFRTRRGERLKRWYPAASLHGIRTWRWRQQVHPKLWHPTSFITWRHDLKMEATSTSETLASYRVHYTASRPEDGGSKFLRNVGILPRSLHGVTTWRWRQQIPPKRWHPTAFTTRFHDL